MITVESQEEKMITVVTTESEDNQDNSDDDSLENTDVFGGKQEKL